MTTPPGSGGLLRRALLALLIAIGGMSGWLLVGTLPIGQALYQRLGGPPALHWQVLLAAGVGLAAGAALLAAGLRGPDRAVGQALSLLRSAAPGDAGLGPPGGARIAELPQAVAEWRRRAEAAGSGQQKFEVGARELIALIRSTRPEGFGASDGARTNGDPVSKLRRIGAEEPDLETLRDLAAAVARLVESNQRQHQVIDALLARVEDDLTAVEAPLRPGATELERALRGLDELIQAWPSLTPLLSLREMLAGSLERVHRSRRAVNLVDRELSAVRRRMGGTRVIRLTTEDFVSGGPTPGADGHDPP